MSRVLLLIGLVILGGCAVLNPQAEETPVIVTATSAQPEFIIITNTPSPAATPVLAATLPPNNSAGDEVSASSISTATPTATATLGISQTPTFTATPTNTVETPGSSIKPVGVGGTITGEIACTNAPGGGFGTIYNTRPDTNIQLGCPIGTATPVSSAYQVYESGIMIWVSSLSDTQQSAIFAIYNNGTFQRFNDTWRDGVDPISVGLNPPAGRLEPIRGFGKIWRESVGVSDQLGWATGTEIGGDGFTLAFERGQMIYIPQNGQTYILVAGAPGVWNSVNQPF